MSDSAYKLDEDNRYDELVQLRLELRNNGEDSDLHCELFFGTAQLSHKEQEYEIGFRKATLRLKLEGCRIALDSSFGTTSIPTVTRNETLNSATGTVLSAGVAIEATDASQASAKAGIEKSKRHELNLTATSEKIPMSRAPGDAWEISSPSVRSTPQNCLIGSPMSGERLCTIQRKAGGNRLAIIGEIHVLASSISVTSKRNFKPTRYVSEYRNKDAIIQQLISKSLKRNVAKQNSRMAAKSLVASRVEISEI